MDLEAKSKFERIRVTTVVEFKVKILQGVAHQCFGIVDLRF